MGSQFFHVLDYKRFVVYWGVVFSCCLYVGVLGCTILVLSWGITCSVRLQIREVSYSLRGGGGDFRSTDGAKTKNKHRKEGLFFFFFSCVLDLMKFVLYI